jgi:hypothetical protein
VHTALPSLFSSRAKNAAGVSVLALAKDRAETNIEGVPVFNGTLAERILPHVRQVGEEISERRIRTAFDRGLRIALGQHFSGLGKDEARALKTLVFLVPSLAPSDMDGYFVCMAQNPWWSVPYARLLVDVNYFEQASVMTRGCKRRARQAVTPAASKAARRTP